MFVGDTHRDLSQISGNYSSILQWSITALPLCCELIVLLQPLDPELPKGQPPLPRHNTFDVVWCIIFRDPCGCNSSSLAAELATLLCDFNEWTEYSSSVLDFPTLIPVNSKGVSCILKGGSFHQGNGYQRMAPLMVARQDAHMHLSLTSTTIDIACFVIVFSPHGQETV